MLAVERRTKVTEIIMRDKSVLVVELAKLFDVTTETIRGDLEKLEKQGVLVRTYGGATLLEGNDETDYSTKTTVNAEGKQRISECAAKMIKNGETIFLDASTASLYIAKAIKDRRNLTVVTNSERVLAELTDCPNINVVSTGGLLTQKYLSYCGRIAEETIRKNYYANKLFFSSRGATIKRGITESTEEDAAIKKAMLDCSETAIFLCDYKKLGKLGVSITKDFKQIDTVITDVRLTEEWREMLDENDIQLIEVLGDK